MKKFSHKIILSLIAISMAISSTLLFPLASVHAAGGSYDIGDCYNILGFNSWNCGVKEIDTSMGDGEDQIKANIWIIAANIALDIAVAASYLVLGYVIYGGYQYTFSGGDPSKVATGKKTLAHAFIGLAIVMSANIIMGSIRIALISSGNIGDCVDNACTTPGDMVTSLINWVTAIAGIISAVFLVFGGVQYMTSSGDPGKLKKAKDTILYSLIGLFIVALAVIITAFVSGIIRDANNTAFNTNKTIISKEVYDPKIH